MFSGFLDYKGREFAPAQASDQDPEGGLRKAASKTNVP
jgi:hypothetical protein